MLNTSGKEGTAALDRRTGLPIHRVVTRPRQQPWKRMVIKKPLQIVDLIVIERALTRTWLGLPLGPNTFPQDVFPSATRKNFRHLDCTQVWRDVLHTTTTQRKHRNRTPIAANCVRPDRKEYICEPYVAPACRDASSITGSIGVSARKATRTPNFSLLVPRKTWSVCAATERAIAITRQETGAGLSRDDQRHLSHVGDRALQLQ